MKFIAIVKSYGDIMDVYARENISTCGRAIFVPSARIMLYWFMFFQLIYLIDSLSACVRRFSPQDSKRTHTTDSSALDVRGLDSDERAFKSDSTIFIIVLFIFLSSLCRSGSGSWLDRGRRRRGRRTHLFGRSATFARHEQVVGQVHRLDRLRSVVQHDHSGRVVFENSAHARQISYNIIIINKVHALTTVKTSVRMKR